MRKKSAHIWVLSKGGGGGRQSQIQVVLGTFFLLGFGHFLMGEGEGG